MSVRLHAGRIRRDRRRTEQDLRGTVVSTGALGQSTCTTSDVGYNASVYTGVLVYLGYENPPQFFFFGGTSEGAPQWAALTALADQAAGHGLGLINPKLYAAGANPGKYSSDFHDVTSGDNGFLGPGFPAKAGYDLPTGLGTPNAANLINDLIVP
jgi:subtilase family serine protease